MSSNKKVVVLATLPIASKEHRDEVKSRLSAMSQDALKQEPHVTKYAIFVPRGEEDSEDIWVLEEYDNQAALDEHMKTQGVADIGAWFGAQGVFKDRAPTIRTLHYLDDKESQFTRPEVSKGHEDPHIVFAELQYKSGGAETAIPLWKAVVAAGQSDEPGTLSYGVLQPNDQPEAISTFEVYESQKYLQDVHVKSDAVAQNIAKTKDSRTGLKHHILQLKHGYLYRS